MDAATFFDKIDSTRLFTVNFNNAGSGNHAGVTEVRIGTVMAKYAFESEVTVNAPATTMEAYSSVRSRRIRTLPSRRRSKTPKAIRSSATWKKTW